MFNKKIKYECPHCGSNEILKDAYASWNVELQEWQLETTYDTTICNLCEGEVTPIEQPV